MRMFLTGRGAAGVDVLRWPVVGRFLRWRHARTSLQLGVARGGDSRCSPRTPRPRHRPGQSRDGPHLGPLPRPAGRRAARRRQLLLRRLSVHPGARLGTPAARAGAALAEAPARQVAGPRALRRRALRLRALRPVGAAARHGVSRPRLLRRGAGDRLGLQGRDVLQASVPDRPVQLRGLDDVAARAADTRAGDVSGLPDVGLHRRTPLAAVAAGRSCNAAASSASSCQPRSATSTARSASTACRPVRTTTSG